MDEEYAAAEPMGVTAMMMPFGGATSFEEIDAAEQAEDTWEAIADLLGQFQGLIGNIACASPEDVPIAERQGRIQAATTEFLRRLGSLPEAERKALISAEVLPVPGTTESTAEATVSVLQRIKAFITGTPETPLIEVPKLMEPGGFTEPVEEGPGSGAPVEVIPEAQPFISSAIAKAIRDLSDGGGEQPGEKATKTEGGVAYNRSDYAVRGSADETGTWKLRLAEGSSGNVTVAQVARAITALQPGGFRGNEVQLGPGEKSEAVRNIGAAISRLGAGGEDKAKLDTLRNRLNAVKELGPSLRVFKDATGGWRYLYRASNRWRDRDYAKYPEGEILAESAHKEYVEWCDRMEAYPEAWLWHTIGTKWGTGDFVAYDSGFLLASGTVDAGKEHVAQALAEMPDLGSSLGFLYHPKDRGADGVYWRYRGFEVSALPVAFAANEVTSLDLTHMKEQSTMIEPQEKRDFLVKSLGADAVAALEASNASISKELDATVQWKSLIPEDAAAPAQKDDSAPAPVAEAPAAAPVAEAAPVTAAPVAEVPAAPAEAAPAAPVLTLDAGALEKALAPLTEKIARSFEQVRDDIAGIKGRQDQIDAALAERKEAEASTPFAANLFGERPTALKTNVITEKQADKRTSTVDPFLASVMNGGGAEPNPNGAAAE